MPWLDQVAQWHNASGLDGVAFKTLAELLLVFDSCVEANPLLRYGTVRMTRRSDGSYRVRDAVIRREHATNDYSVGVAWTGDPDSSSPNPHRASCRLTRSPFDERDWNC
jgi:hypothetical protein